jgi:hypothetical protein
MQTHIPILLTPDEAQTLRTLNAKICGYIGGSKKSAKRAAASRRNIKRAIRARKLQLVAA